MSVPNSRSDADGYAVRVFDAGLAFAFGIVATGALAEWSSTRSLPVTEDALILGALLGVISSGLAAPCFCVLVLAVGRCLHRDPPKRIAAFAAGGATFAIPVLVENILAWVLWFTIAPLVTAVVLSRRRPPGPRS